jgi:hypothetical protein
MFGNDQCSGSVDSAVENGNAEQSPTRNTSNPTGLHWETTYEISDIPPQWKSAQGSSVKQEYKHLFQTPIDSMFALIPYMFWEIMVQEVDRYADACLKKKKTKSISG